LISYTSKFNQCDSFNVLGAQERDYHISAMLACGDYYKSISYRLIKSDGTFGKVYVVKSLLKRPKIKIINIQEE
ncbi:MAG: hypothetical protein QXI16_05380, partial [Sulfolobaceae archaeon]